MQEITNTETRSFVRLIIYISRQNKKDNEDKRSLKEYIPEKSKL